MPSLFTETLSYLLCACVLAGCGIGGTYGQIQASTTTPQTLQPSSQTLSITATDGSTLTADGLTTQTRTLSPTAAVSKHSIENTAISDGNHGTEESSTTGDNSETGTPSSTNSTSVTFASETPKLPSMSDNSAVESSSDVLSQSSGKSTKSMVSSIDIKSDAPNSISGGTQEATTQISGISSTLLSTQPSSTALAFDDLQTSSSLMPSGAPDESDISSVYDFDTSQMTPFGTLSMTGESVEATVPATTPEVTQPDANNTASTIEPSSQIDTISLPQSSNPVALTHTIFSTSVQSNSGESNSNLNTELTPADTVFLTDSLHDFKSTFAPSFYSTMPDSSPTSNLGLLASITATPTHTTASVPSTNMSSALPSSPVSTSSKSGSLAPTSSTNTSPVPTRSTSVPAVSTASTSANHEIKPTPVIPEGTKTAESSTTVTHTPVTPSSSTVIPTKEKSKSDPGLSTGGKVALGIIIPVGIIGLALLGFFVYKRYNLTHRSLKTFLTQGVRYKTYSNASFKDDEVAMDGAWRTLSDTD